MDTLVVVVLSVMVGEVVEVPRPEHDEVVEALLLDRLDHTLGVGVVFWLNLPETTVC